MVPVLNNENNVCFHSLPLIILKVYRNRQVERQTDRQTDRQTSRQIDRQTDRQTVR